MTTSVLESQVSRVTVYRDGALVERTATIAVDETDGTRQVTLGGLPVCLDDGSVRLNLEAKGEPGLIAQDFSVALELVERDSGDDSGESLRDEIRATKSNLAALELKANRIDGGIQRLQALSTPERPRPEGAAAPTPNPTEARLTLQALVDDRIVKLTAEGDDLALRRMEIEQRLTHLNMQLDEMNEEPEVDAEELKKAVHLQLRNSGGRPGGEVRLTLSYLVPGAHWYPSYSLYTTRDTGNELAMHAYVAQRSGEDWNGVDLRLSTAAAQQWTRLPELQSLRIGRRQHLVPNQGWRAAPVGTELLFADYDVFKLRAEILDEPPAQPGAVVQEEASPDDDGSLLDDGSSMDDEPSFGGGAFEMADEEADVYPSELPPESQVMMPVAESRAERSKSAPAPAKKLRRAMDDFEKEADLVPQTSEVLGTGGSGGSGEPGEYGEPDEQFLEYHKLRMPTPDDYGRGRLRLVAGADERPNRRGLDLVSQALAIAVDLAQPLSTAEQPCDFEGFDFAFDCSTPVSIPSQYDLTYLPVIRQSVETTQRYVAVPREGPVVYRMATVSNPMDNPLPAGPVDIYRGGEFFVTGYLTVVAPRGKTEVGLGVEQGVKIARNTVFAENSEGGLLGGALSLQHEIDIDLINNLKNEIAIEIRERVPVTREDDDDVRVEITEVSPAWKPYTGEFDRDRGSYFWSVKIPPGGTSALKATYRVRISAKNELVGGNRREA